METKRAGWQAESRETQSDGGRTTEGSRDADRRRMWGDRMGKMSIWGLERSGGRLGRENRCEDRVGVHARETREREDVGAQQGCRGRFPHFTSKSGGAKGPRRREEPLWMHRPQATLNHPLWAARSRSWVQCTGTARPRFLCVSPSRCLGNRLVAQQPALLSPCLEPGGLSGQQWSDGSHACLRPLPVQALGKGKEGAEEEGGREIPAERDRPFCDGIGSPQSPPSAWEG